MHLLVSLPQLLNDKCKVNVTKNSVNTFKNNKEIICGPGDPLTQMWTVPFNINHSPPASTLHTIKIEQEILCNTYTQKLIADLVTYHHITLRLVAPPTLFEAIKNGFPITFPGLTVQAVQKYLQKSIQYYLSHIHKIRKNTRSTKNQELKN